MKECFCVDAWDGNEPWKFSANYFAFEAFDFFSLQPDEGDFFIINIPDEEEYDDEIFLEEMRDERYTPEDEDILEMMKERHYIPYD